VSEEKFLDHETRLDGLAQADIVSDQQVGARHLDRSNDGVKLVILDGDAAPEGRLKSLKVGIGDSPPAYGVQERR
jgi:hypothetical protein